MGDLRYRIKGLSYHNGAVDGVVVVRSKLMNGVRHR